MANEKMPESRENREKKAEWALKRAAIRYAREGGKAATDETREAYDRAKQGLVRAALRLAQERLK